MDSNRKKIILLSIFVIIFILITVFIFFDLFSKDKITNVLLVDGLKQNDVNDVENDETTTNKDNEQSEGNVINFDNDNLVENDNDENVAIFDDAKENFSSEYDIVSYFENIDNEVEESSSFKEKFKEYFITIVDFIFYEKEIKGYTFDDLSSTSKAKIISIALKIDNKIEEYVPNYKENISSTSNKIYTGIKDKLIVLYMDISTDICKNNEEECNKVKEIFSEIKDVCKIGWDFIKNLFKGGFSKIKDWYEIYSGK